MPLNIDSVTWWESERPCPKCGKDMTTNGRIFVCPFCGRTEAPKIDRKHDQRIHKVEKWD